MPSSKGNRPTPEQLLIEVKGKASAKTYEFDDFIEVVDELHRKEYSYADIAEFLARRLKISVSRGQVYRAHRMWRVEKNRINIESQEAMESETGAVEILEIGQNEKAANEVLELLNENYLITHPEADLLRILRETIALLESRKVDEAAADEADRHKILQNEARARAKANHSK